MTPGPIETVTGSERLGWQQTAADAAEIATFHYAIYVDTVRSELSGVTCTPPATPTSASFSCAVPLPALTAGPHTIELASFIVDGGTTVESARSAALRVNKAIAAASPMPGPAAPGNESPDSAPPDSTAPVKWPSGMTVSTADGLRLRVDRLAAGLVRPADMTFVPDGRLFVAEESGRIVVLTPDGRLAQSLLPPARSRQGNIRLLSLTADSQFDTTHFVYAVYTTSGRDGSPVFTLSRFSESSNQLFGEIVLLDPVVASATSAASVRVGADGKLFAMFDDGGDFRRAGDLASPNGKLLRLNPDGTTPADQAGLTAAYATDFHSPRGFDWQPGSRVLWITDRISGDSASLTAVASGPGTQQRGAKIAAYALPPDTRPSSAVFVRGSALPGLRNNLLIASAEGRHLLRLRFDAEAGTSVVATERLLQDVVGAVRVVAVSPDGGLYIVTDDSVARIAPAE